MISNMLKKYFLYVLVAISYLIPIIFSKDNHILIPSVLIFIPLIVFVLSIVSSVINGFNFLFSVIVIVMWFFMTILFIESISLLFSLIYGIISVAGQYVGGYSDGYLQENN